MTLLTREFVERHTSTLHNVSPEWEVSTGHYYYYQLGMRMSQIRYLRYEFTWGSEQQPVPKAAPITQQPSRILVLDVSLNDLTALPHDGLSPFKQLRVLDASLNRIDNIAGIEVLPHLYLANFSHNKIRSVRGLQFCRVLVDLNLSMNELDDITRFPALTSLRVLHLSNNRLKSLQGIQVLSGLQELYVQRNQLTDLVPLASCLRLTALNAADNAITSISTTLHVLRGFKRLDSLCLYGNPIDRDSQYQAQLTTELSLTSLDNVNLLPHQQPLMIESPNELYAGPFRWWWCTLLCVLCQRFPPIQPLQPVHSVQPFPAAASFSSSHHLSRLRDIARAAFNDHLQSVRGKMEDNARFLQSRINVLQEDYAEYERRMYQDLEACLSYIDRLPPDETRRYNYEYFRHHLTTQDRTPWLQSDWRRPASEQRYPSSYLTQRPQDSHTLPLLPRKRDNYRNVKQTDEILRCAYNELLRERVALSADHI